jgi:hypothetical protein
MTSEPHYAMRKIWSNAVETIQRAFEEFLTVPTALIVAFVLLAAGTYALDQFRPAALTLVFLLTAMALYVLVLLLYTIINQTRPSEITAAIHDRTLAARMRELDVIAKTRASLAGTFATHRDVVSSQHGFVVRVDVDRLCSATRKHDGGAIV